MKREIMATRPPVPPFTRETAIQKVRLAEDGWNSRDPEKVSLASSVSSNLKTEKSPASTCTGIMPACWPNWASSIGPKAWLRASKARVLCLNGQE